MGSVEETSCDILVVGAGIFGTSTAYHLSLTHNDPSRVIVLDRAPVPSPQAASSDINKIVRADYTKAFYMNLAYEAMEYWTTSHIMKPYFHQTGWLALDEKSSDVAERIRKNFRESGRPDTSSDISLEEAKTCWGGVFKGIDTSDYDKAYTNSSAGWADASGAVESMMKEAMFNGIKYETGEVTELLCTDQGLAGVQISTGKVYRAEQILLATGAWTPWLMEPLEQALGISDSKNTIHRQIQAAGVCVAAYKLSEEEAKYYGQMPVLIYGARGEVMPPNKDRLFKFTNAGTFYNTQQFPGTNKSISRPLTSATVDNDGSELPESLRTESIDLIRQRIPEILDHGREPDIWRLCWDAISPDQSQLIAQHPDPRLSNLYFATAGSFHSWKFLPNIGRYVANVLRGVSNGEENDLMWKWKTEEDWKRSGGRGAHEKVKPIRDLVDLF